MQYSTQKIIFYTLSMIKKISVLFLVMCICVNGGHCMNENETELNSMKNEILSEYPHGWPTLCKIGNFYTDYDYSPLNNTKQAKEKYKLYDSMMQEVVNILYDRTIHADIEDKNDYILACLATADYGASDGNGLKNKFTKLLDNFYKKQFPVAKDRLINIGKSLWKIEEPCLNKMMKKRSFTTFEEIEQNPDDFYVFNFSADALSLCIEIFKEKDPNFLLHTIMPKIKACDNLNYEYWHQIAGI